ncbi:MAG: hypothetical protein HKN18_13490 [Silicimonas sp.]|nr:hypothetical protein [Silicimonas sp.]
MGRGFLSGIFWGGIVGVGLLFVSSQTLERQQLSFPKPEAGEVDVPGGSEFNQARPETDPVLPDPESRPEPEAVTGVTAPDDAVETPPSFDTTALEVPKPATTPDGLGAVPDTPNDPPEPPLASDGARPADTGADLVQPESPGITPAAETEAPEETAEPAPEEDDSPDIGAADDAPTETDVAALPQADAESPIGSDTGTAPSVTSEDTAPETMEAPTIGEEPSLPQATEDTSDAPRLPQISEPTTPSAGDAPEVADAPEAPTAPSADTESSSPEGDTDSGAGSLRADGGETSFLKPVEDLGDQADNVETDRLPRIGDSGDSGEGGTLPTVRRFGSDSEAETTEAEDAGDEAPEIAEDGALPEQGGPALLTYRTDFENPEGHPLLSLVLIHEGDAPLAADILEGLPEHVAFAIEAGGEQAAEIAKAYRAAGREVVMIPSLPKGATPQDVEQALRVNFEAIPEAVAVMDVTGGSFQSDRNAVEQVVDVVMDTGHGLITFPRGLNAAHQRAERAGVPTGLIFRQLDGGDETSEQIRRTMDRAAFRARRDDAVILVGSTGDATLAAVVEWAMGNRATSVTIAPISAALSDG